MLRRLAPVDWLLIGGLFPIWLIALGLHVWNGAVNQCADLPFSVASAPVGDYPRIAFLWRGVLEIEGLATGDRVLELEGRDLGGMSTATFLATAFSEARKRTPLHFVFDRGGERIELTVTPLQFPAGWWSTIPFGVGLGLTAILLLIRAPDWPMRRRFFVAAIAYALFVAFYRSLGGLATYIWMITTTVSLPVATGLTLLIVLEWSSAGRLTRAWQIALGASFAVGFGVLGLWMNFFPAPVGVRIHLLYNGLLVLFLVSLLLAIVWTALRTTKLERRQGKWIALGFYVACVPFAAALLAGLVGLPLSWELLLIFVGRLALTAVPIGILISVAFYQYLDVDRIIGASATYTLLGVALLGGALFLVPRLAAGATNSLGVDDSTGQAALSLLFAAVAVPIYRVVRPRVDRWLLADRHALRQGFDALTAELASGGSVVELTRAAGERLDELLRPDSCVVYARTGESCEPIFARGRAIPAAIAEGPLTATLEGRKSPLASHRFSRRDRLDQLSAFDRAVLATLGAAVVLPVHRRDELVAFLCLGPKRSGDVYTPDDLTLLSLLSDRVSLQLDRLEDAELVADARAMQRELRRYVPGAVADSLASGAEIEPGQREVTVAFVDLRDYTRFAESRPVAETFSTVNRYTETVSEIARQHEGSVVEFNGDGMMIVFGAPAELNGKERAAVEAAREIVSAVASLPVEGVGHATQLMAGVGIATGDAFVGNIRAVDRMIWSAIGNTTNLAARLQGLTRELEAAIVVDRVTRERAGPVAADFVGRPAVTIRGRSQTEDVFALPILSEASVRVAVQRGVA